MTLDEEMSARIMIDHEILEIHTYESIKEFTDSNRSRLNGQDEIYKYRPVFNTSNTKY